jgi:hypothetical protein
MLHGLGARSERGSITIVEKAEAHVLIMVVLIYLSTNSGG